MNRTAPLALLVGVVLLVVVAAAPAAATTGGVAAQENNSTTSTTETGERIDEELELLSSTYDEDDGTATLTLRADGAVAVTFSDAGGFVDGGEITRRTVVLDDGRNTVELPVTETDAGYVGVAIATQNVLYGEVITPEQKLLPGLQSEYSGGVVAGSVVTASMVGVGTMVVLLFVVSKHLKKRRSL